MEKAKPAASSRPAHPTPHPADLSGCFSNYHNLVN